MVSFCVFIVCIGGVCGGVVLVGWLNRNFYSSLSVLFRVFFGFGVGLVNWLVVICGEWLWVVIGMCRV